MNNEDKCKVEYGFWDGNDFQGLIWTTPKGRIITMNGTLNPSSCINIKDADGNKIKDVEMLEILEEILGI